jgi:uncharacterized membrane protein YedE/YeeE
MKNFKYFIVGIVFGFILIKAEVISWFRIQEMFHFQSFHMYGIIGSAIAVGALSILIIKKFNIKSSDGNPIIITPKKLDKGTAIGGLLFGFGWALTGACPGPLYALVGSGHLIILVVLLSAIVGTFVYGILKEKLPH